MKKGFTLIEMMISISILSIIMIFLYQAYSDLNKSNQKYKTIVAKIDKNIKIKKVVYLDFLLSLTNNVYIQNQDVDEDIVILQTTNSIHNNINPYVSYIVKDNKLYRIESLIKPTIPFGVDLKGVVDYIEEVNRFRVYKALKKDNNNTKTLYLIDIDFKNIDDILYKITSLNQ